jgi:hypothetical protein
LARLVQADLSANGRIEVITTSINPGIVILKLHDGNVICCSNAVTRVPLHNCIHAALIVNAKRTILGEVGTVGLEVVVY